MLSIGSIGKKGSLTLHREIDGGAVATLSAEQGGFYLFGGASVLSMPNSYANCIALGANAITTAMWGIKGSGSTSATTSLLVQNSSGTELFKVKDNGETSLNGNLVITSSAFSGNLFFQCIGNNQQQIRGAYGESIYFGRGGNTLELTATEVYVSNSFYGPAHGLTTGGLCLGATSGPVASAQLEMRSTTKGFLKPKMTTAQKNAIATPAAGLEIYDTDLNRPCFYNGTSWITL
jgi:hypothetical protein